METKETKETKETEEETVTDQQVEEEPKIQEESLEEELKEKEELNERLLRLQAEFTNYKRRVEKEKRDLYVYGCENLAKDLLPVIDNLERALDAVEDQEESLYKGVEMVYNQTLEVLKKHGVEPIAAEGCEFDMNKHHAVMTEPCEQDELKETVAQVLQRGYTIEERVLRPAMVKVYK
ncbi:MAG: nucleotide exchange factor GrpE [Tindallia sp. MSAO_Bac2]|nr:MAG: nucleotide exchange factor GrpE [Tindallia sp. MSAO_Bac2]